MSDSRTITKKYVSLPMVISSFLGMMMAVPLVFALSSSATGANTFQNQATSQVAQADFAKFAYAFNQGYEAHTANATVNTPGTCVEASSSSESGSGGAGAVSASTASVVTKPMGGYGGMGSTQMHHDDKSKGHDAKFASMVNSYNTYTSMIYNSSSVTNTNSNNTVGSNNVTKTEIDVEDAKGVLVAVDNSQHQSQINTNDSFNKDSYNTKTETTVINDSFNKETNVAIDSGNTTTTTENVDVTKIEDSYNTENKTETENSNNTTTTTNETTNTENKTIDSYNETNIDVNKESGHHEGDPYNNPSVI